jgi:4-amino-4-deoxy-L-arabinose transferase-like glycosyltransferase
LALIIRLLAIPVWGGYDLRSTFDQGEYIAIAQNVRLHGAFSYGEPHRWGERAALDAPGPYDRTAARAPLYPFMVVTLWWGHEPPVLAVRLVQVGLGGIVALMVYLMAFEAFGFGAALFAGLAMALAPLSAYTTVLLLSETLFTFLLTASLWFWTRKRGVLAGLMLGAATLTRGVCLPIIGALLLLSLVTKVNRALHLKIALMAIVVVAPWTIRNAISMHDFIPVNSIGFGANMLLGTIYVPYGSGNEFATFNQDKGFTDIAWFAPSAEDAERQMSQLAKQRILADPVHWFWIRLKQYPRFWIGTGSFVSPERIVRYAFILGSIVFWGAAAAGMFLARYRWRELYPIAFFPTLLAMTHFTGSGDDRYSLGLVPMAAIFAGHTLSMLVGRKKPA